MTEETQNGKICADNMFSGHALFLTAAYFMVALVLGKNILPPLIKFFATVVYVGVALSISASRLHYSSDVLVSVALTFLLFGVYYPRLRAQAVLCGF